MIATTLVVLLALELLSLFTMPSVLLRRRGNPVSASMWLVALVALPGIAWLSWWIFGRTHLNRKARRRHAASERFSNQYQSLSQRNHTTIFDSFVPRRALNTAAFSSINNKVRLLRDGPAIFPAIESELKKAKRCIHVFFFAFEMDDTGKRFLDLLIEQSKRGVTVRLLVDGLGTQAGEKEIRKLLAETSVEMGVFLPKRIAHLPRFNFVNHRKIVVIDNEIGFTGGANVGDQYAKEWRDLMVRLEGPVVPDLNHVFLEDWYFATDELLEPPCASPPSKDADQREEEESSVLLVASGPSTEGWIHDAFFSAIASAKRRVWLTSPYLIPTTPLRQALRSAAGRGVDVRIVIPRNSDVWVVTWAARPYFRPFIKDGVKIFEYPTMVHGKSLIVDDICSVGSANIDQRSMELSFEICCFYDDKTLTQELSDWHEELVSGGKEVTLEQLSRMTKRDRLVESLAHLLSPLL